MYIATKSEQIHKIIKSEIKSAIVLKKDFDSEQVHNETYLKTKIKSYNVTSV